MTRRTPGQNWSELGKKAKALVAALPASGLKATAAVAIGGLIALSAVAVSAVGPARSLTGGGQIVDGDLSISFGGVIQAEGDGLDLGDLGIVYMPEEMSGQWELNFHNVGDPDFDGGRFHSTGFVSFFAEGHPLHGPSSSWAATNGACKSLLFVGLAGKFNGEEGYKLNVIASDNNDAIWLVLSNGGVIIYNSGASFADEIPGCPNPNLAELDRGNVTIRGLN